MKKIKQKDIKRFVELTQELNSLMYEIVEYCPEANIYVEDSHNMNLMHGPSHCENHKPLFGNVAEQAFILTVSGGGW